MAHFARFVSMVRTPKEIKEDTDKLVADTVKMEQPLYPYGLCISLDDDILSKLDIDDDCDVGDTIHLCCLAKVTSSSKRDTSEGPKHHIELQITDMAVEDEDEENDAAVKRMAGRYSKKED
jgi:hypothetical protein